MGYRESKDFLIPYIRGDLTRDIRQLLIVISCKPLDPASVLNSPPSCANRRFVLHWHSPLFPNVFCKPVIYRIRERKEAVQVFRESGVLFPLQALPGHFLKMRCEDNIQVCGREAGQIGEEIGGEKRVVVIRD